MLPLKITFVAPLPRKILANNVHPICDHIPVEDKRVDPKISSLYDDLDQSEAGVGDDDGITALPSLYGAMLAKDSNNSSAAVSHSSYPLGLWLENKLHENLMVVVVISIILILQGETYKGFWRKDTGKDGLPS